MAGERKTASRGRKAGEPGRSGGSAAQPERKPLAPPSNLGDEALKWWDRVTAVYALRVDEMRLLEDACREIDIIERLNQTINRPNFPLMVRGSMGQKVVNPLLQEVRQHRATLAAMLKQLKLPDALPGAASAERKDADTSTSARKAAIARWGRGG